MFEKEENAPLPTEEANTEEVVMLLVMLWCSNALAICSLSCLKVLKWLICHLQQGDAKNKTKVWQNKNKGAKKAAKSKKKKLTKKKPVTQQQAKGDKAKQANGNVAGNVRKLELCSIQW